MRSPLPPRERRFPPRQPFMQHRSRDQQLTVYLLTMGPGDQVWEKFGHDAIWIHDESNHTDIAYNWGIFDFADKDFYAAFRAGQDALLAGRVRSDRDGRRLPEANRTVWAQELNLAPVQRQQLARFRSVECPPGKSFLPLRLLSRQLLHPSPRRDRTQRSED